MERRLHFRANNAAPITAVAYHPARKEIVTGHEGMLQLANNSVFTKCHESHTSTNKTKCTAFVSFLEEIADLFLQTNFSSALIYPSL